MRWDSSSTTLRVLFSPKVLVVPALAAAAGLWTGLGLGWVVGAAVVAWIGVASLRLRGPSVVSGLLAPGFDRDVSKLDRDHRRYLIAGLAARDRFDEAVAGFGLGEEFGGMQLRIVEALDRLYDSLAWAQQAARFVRDADRPALERRLAAVDPESPVARELSAQLAEIDGVRRRRRAVLDQAAATVTGLETLATKMRALALQTGTPDGRGVVEVVGDLKDELDSYVAALAEIETELHRLPPGPA